MQKIILCFTFLIVISFIFSLNTMGQEIEGFFLYQASTSSSGNITSDTSSGSPKNIPPSKAYIIIDGPGAGTTLFAGSDELSISEMSNPLTKANGHIGGIGVGEGMNCPGPLGHFHGTLRDSKDPAEDMCGWGHVASYNDTSLAVRSISNQVGDEIFILSLIEDEPPDYAGAADRANTAVMNLNTLQDEIRDPSKTMIGKGKAQQISDKLGKVINSDKFVSMTLNPLPEKRDPGKDAAISLKINNALKAKQDALMILIEAGSTSKKGKEKETKISVRFS